MLPIKLNKISFDNNSDFKGQMEYPLLSSAHFINTVYMDISSDGFQRNQL